MLVTSDELTYNIVDTQETDENIRNIKKLLPSSKTSEFILNNNVLFKISEKQELLVVPEMVQIGQQEDARGEWENVPRKTEKSSISERRVGNNREVSIWKQDEAMD
ncbi:hypothetical protein TNCV_1715001 [Trichonephila clavipes]|nr:hypothetical protein TNCV_1715001 [Trichonephila clavipes]